MPTTMEDTSILIVDDLDVWRELLQDILSTAGYKCHTAASREEAIDMLSKRSYKLAILDMRLKDDDPGDRGGMEIVRWLQEVHADTKAIILTGYPKIPDAVEVFRSGMAVDYLEKCPEDGSFNVERFIARVEEILKST